MDTIIDIYIALMLAVLFLPFFVIKNM